MDWLSKSNHMRETMPRKTTRKTMVFNVGINDADYVVDPSKKSGIGPCPAYKAWSRIMQRAYSNAFLSDNPTYHGVSVHEDWHKFSSFREWWCENVVHGWEIDKDLIMIGNMQYGPDVCIFIPKWLNVIVNGSSASRGDLPIGVYYHKREKRYRAQISMCEGRQKQLGSFSSPLIAYNAWLSAKLEYIESRKKDIDSIDVRIYSNVLKKIRSHN